MSSSKVVHQALTVARPKLRYMIGRKAKFAVGLRRWLPGEAFERLYFGAVMRRATQGGPQLESKPALRD